MRIATSLACALCALLLPRAGAAAAPAEEAPPYRDAQDEALTRPGREPLRVPPFLEPLRFPIGFAGYFWVDTGYMQRTNAREGQYDQDASYMQGRFVLAAQYYQEFGDLFGTAKAELIGFVNEYTKSQFEPHVLDAYVMIGGDWWDVQVGRFLAWEVYHRGQGIELYTAEEAGALDGPALYWLETARGHLNEAGQAAVHFYVGDTLGIEIAGVYGQETNQNRYGVRPVVDLRLWGLQLIAGYEFLTQLPQTDADKVELTSHGYALRLAYTFPHVTLGADFAQRFVEYIDIQGLVDGERTFDTLSAGGYADIDFWISSIGLGYHYTLQETEAGESDVHHQTFFSYLVRLPIEGLSLKAVYGFAWAHIQDVDVMDEWDNYMHSVRLRIAYDFD